MKKLTLLLVVLVLGAVTAALAVPPGKTLTFDKSPMGTGGFLGNYP